MKNIIATINGGIEAVPRKKTLAPHPEIKKNRQDVRDRVTDIVQIDQQPIREKEGITRVSAGIPAMIIENALKKYNFHTEEELRDMMKDHTRANQQGEQNLESFLDSAKKPFNLFYIDNNLSKVQLEKRLKMLSDLYFEYKSLDSNGRGEMEEVLGKMFDIPTMSDATQKYLDTLESDDLTAKSQGAENTNLIFMNSNMEAQVIKRTKGRHSIDFTSILKLMYNMHAMALHFNQNPNAGGAKVSFKDMVIYKNKDGQYVRMVRQNFAKGTLLKEIDPKIKEDPSYRKAWHAFLRQVDGMRDTFGSVVDISDSTKGTKARGNVANSGNIFVEFPTKQNPQYVFTIIDPDVFDTEPGEAKFDPSEHVRKNGMSGIIPAVRIGITNFMRDTKKFGMGVRNWQEQFMKKELGK